MNPSIPIPAHRPPSVHIGTPSDGRHQAKSNSEWKIRRIWNAIPKSVSLPFQTALALSTPTVLASIPSSALASSLITASASKAIAGLGMTAWTVPQDLRSFFLGTPMNFSGARIQPYQMLGLQSDVLPKNPENPLTDLNQKILSFERTAKTLPLPDEEPLIALANSPSAEPQTPKAKNEREHQTDAHLHVVIDKVSRLSMLYTMLYASGIEEPNPMPILLQIADKASLAQAKGKTNSLWDFFQAHYRNQLGWLGWAKAKSVYSLGWQASLIPKTVDAYLTNLLRELRINLKENGEKRKQLINGILDDLDNVLDIYNGAAETYVQDSARKGNLNRYRKMALDMHLQAEEHKAIEGLSPKEARMDSCLKLSASVIDHFSPQIKFRFAEDFLNARIRSLLKYKILPEIFFNITVEGKDAAKQYNTPFLLALTKTMTSQLGAVQASLEEGSGDAVSSSSGIKNFEGTVKKLMRAIDLADYNTPEEMRKRLAELENRSESETYISSKVRVQIQEGIQKGLAVLFDYLSKQENTEQLFSLCFESLLDPLSGKMPLTEEEWTAMETEYKAANVLLKQAAHSLFTQIIKKAVEDYFFGSELVDRTTQTIFLDHKSRGQKSFTQIEKSASSILRKIDEMQKNPTSSNHIYAELKNLVDTLKSFQNAERLQIIQNQDPLPPIGNLPDAHRQSILRTLYPFYQDSNRLMDHCLSLQKQQQYQILFANLTAKCRELQGHFVHLQNPKSDRSLIAAKIRETVTELKPLCASASMRMEDLFKQTDQILHSAEELSNAQKTLKIFEEILALRDHPPITKHKAQLQTLADLVLKESSEKKTFYSMIEKIKLAKSLEEKEKIWDQLTDWIRVYQILSYQTIKRVSPLFSVQLAEGEKLIAAQVGSSQNLVQNSLRAMQANANKLYFKSSLLLTKMNQAETEKQITPSSDHAAILGFAAGGAFGLLSSSLAARLELSQEAQAASASFIGAAFGSAMFYMARCLSSRVETNTSGELILGGVSSMFGGAAAAGISTLLPSWIPPSLLGATIASAGLEYAASNKKLAVDLTLDIAVPKVQNKFEKANEHLLQNPILIDSGLKTVMKQIVSLFPPKTAATT